MGEIFRHVYCFLIRRARLAQRHVVLDKTGGSIGSGHACTDIERLISPKWWNYKLIAHILKSLTIGSVASSAFLFVDGFSVSRLGHKVRVNVVDACTIDFGMLRQASRQPIQIKRPSHWLQGNRQAIPCHSWNAGNSR